MVPPNMKMMLKLRNDLLRKPLGFSFDPKELEKEKDDVLIGAFEDDRMLGCCLLTKIDDKTLRLRPNGGFKQSPGKGNRTGFDDLCRKHSPGYGLLHPDDACPCYRRRLL